MTLTISACVGCEALRSFLNTPEGQDTANRTLNLIDAIANLIPIPGVGLVDEVLATVIAMWTGQKIYRGGVNMLKNSEKGKIVGSPMKEDGE